MNKKHKRKFTSFGMVSRTFKRKIVVSGLLYGKIPANSSTIHFSLVSSIVILYFIIKAAN